MKTTDTTNARMQAIYDSLMAGHMLSPDEADDICERFNDVPRDVREGRTRLLDDWFICRWYREMVP